MSMARKATAQHVSDHVGVDVKTVRRWANEGCPHDRAGPGKPIKYNLDEVDAWMRRRGLTGKVGRPVQPETDPLLTGGSSPALEQYRKHRASLAGLDVAERVGMLVNVADIRAAFGPAIQAMRSTGDRLVRLYGNEAGTIFNEGVGEFESAALRIFESQDVKAKRGG